MDREAGLILKAGKAVRLTEYMSKEELHLPAPIDEVSLLFATEAELDDFVLWAKANNRLNHFNSTRDIVVCERADWHEPGISVPRGIESFAVRFEFLRLPGSEWRIEAMCVLGGSAPLHEAWLEKYGTGCVVHTSYKVSSPATYAERLHQGVHAFHWLPQPTLRATYANSYGRFAYYQHPNFSDNGSSWLLKLRVNLRDI